MSRKNLIITVVIALVLYIWYKQGKGFSIEGLKQVVKNPLQATAGAFGPVYSSIMPVGTTTPAAPAVTQPGTPAINPVKPSEPAPSSDSAAGMSSGTSTTKAGFTPYYRPRRSVFISI